MKLPALHYRRILGSIQSIQLFLGPLIVSLAVPIVKQIDLIKKHILPIIVGSLVGAIVSMGSILILGPLFGLTPELVASIVPKSATTPIAIEVADMLHGIRSIAVFVVVVTAIIAAVTFPTLFRWLKLKDPVVIGMTFGANAHALGTAKAIEIDPVAGAISGIALVFSGIATALIALFL
ncbi:MAG: LrgB family protein [Bacillus subtilis]|nr:LrgB family protein [Bacillus subtilis]